MSDLDIFFRPEVAQLLPDEVVCGSCNYTHYFRLKGCPNPCCTAFVR